MYGIQGVRADRLQRGREVQVHDLRATMEGAVADLDDRVRQPQLQEVRPLLVRPLDNLRHAVRHDKPSECAIGGFHRVRWQPLYACAALPEMFC